MAKMLFFWKLTLSLILTLLMLSKMTIRYRQTTITDIYEIFGHYRATENCVNGQNDLWKLAKMGFLGPFMQNLFFKIVRWTYIPFFSLF